MRRWAWLPLSCFSLLLQSGSSSAANISKTCRSKFGHFVPSNFDHHACAWCYHFITQSPDIVVYPPMNTLVVRTNQSVYPQWTILVANFDNSSLADKVCKTTTADLCRSWKSCCQDARACCQRQLQTARGEDDFCPRTWDGYGCWDDTRPGTTKYRACPGFLRFSIPSRYAEKKCTSEGHWYMLGNATNDQSNEWTDYTKCLDKESYLVSLYLGMACRIVSIILLVPSLFVFFFYRSLRRQHRIRLHINFFSAMLLADVLDIIWDVLVSHARLHSTHSLSDGAGCKILSILRLYARSATYVWMFCEGFYLHRLISNAFKPPKSLMLLYITGWGCPLIYTSIYGMLRLIYVNDSCWIRSNASLQWIVFIPHLFCLGMNFLFLCNILRILLTKLKSHPNEPSNFRRALKATFVLIPLFGVQLFVSIYRLPAGTSGDSIYEKFTVIVRNSQGFFIALIFCFFNGEIVALQKCMNRP